MTDRSPVEDKLVTPDLQNYIRISDRKKTRLTVIRIIQPSLNERARTDRSGLPKPQDFHTTNLCQYSNSGHFDFVPFTFPLARLFGCLEIWFVTCVAPRAGFTYRL